MQGPQNVPLGVFLSFLLSHFYMRWCLWFWYNLHLLLLNLFLILKMKRQMYASITETAVSDKEEGR